MSPEKEGKVSFIVRPDSGINRLLDDAEAVEVVMEGYDDPPPIINTQSLYDESSKLPGPMKLPNRDWKKYRKMVKARRKQKIKKSRKK